MVYLGEVAKMLVLHEPCDLTIISGDNTLGSKQKECECPALKNPTGRCDEDIREFST